MVWRLWTGIEVLLVAVLLAAALSPIVDRLERWGLSRQWAVAALATCAVLLLGAFVTLVAPPLATQVTVLMAPLPGLRAMIAGGIERYGALSHVLRPLLDLPASPAVAEWLSERLRWGKTFVEATAAALLVVVLSFYLLLDGRAVVAWLLAYVPRRHRGHMSATVPEVFDVVKAFVTGQLTAFGLFALFCFVVLSAHRVPAALPRALLRGLRGRPDSVDPRRDGGRGADSPHGQPGDFARRPRPHPLLPPVRGLPSPAAPLRRTPAAVDTDRPSGDRRGRDARWGRRGGPGPSDRRGVPSGREALAGGHLHPDAVEDHASLRAAGIEGTEGHDAAVEAVLRGEEPAPPV
ncbi:MAG: AI-2E family transporter [Holophagales bacterium]|nr:AI-2E family transporter [Holophagales bacterium]